MDIGAFSDVTFDTKEWINKTLRSPEAQENKEVFISSLVAKLQLYVQQVNAAVEDTSDYVVQSLPRVMHDADIILKEAHLLKDKMQSVKEEIMKIEKDTAVSMETLEKLDRMKTELQTAKQALHEADKWTLLASDIEEEFETHKIDAIADKVISMQQSLPALVDSGNFEERKLQLEVFKNRLEAIASPHLVNAFTNKNVEESQKFVKMFTGIQRLPQLIKYYIKCEKNSVCQKWKNLIDVDQDLGIQELFNQFYRDLLTEYETQVKWCQTVFGGCGMVLTVLGEALVGLEPEMSAVLNTALRRETEASLPLLLSLRATSDNFLSQLKTLLYQNNETAAEESWREVYCSVYKVYRTWISGYGRLEERALSTALLGTGTAAASGGAAGGTALSESVACLGLTRQALATGLAQALSRSLALTSHLGLPALVSATQFCILKHLEQYEDLLREIEIEKQNKEEWSMFQICLSLLQNAADLQTTLEEMDSELVQALEESLRIDKGSEIDLKKVFFNRAALEQYEAFMNSFKSGERRSVLEGVKSKTEKVRERVAGVCSEVMLAPVRLQLARAAWLSVPHHLPLPDYSYAPLEYITQIGEYLMTLPQHLEPFMKEEGGGSSPAVQLLGRVCRQSSTALADLILSTKDVSPHAAKQMSVDIVTIVDDHAKESRRHVMVSPSLIFRGALSLDEYRTFLRCLTKEGLNLDLPLMIDSTTTTKIDYLILLNLSYLGNVLEDLGQSLPEPLVQMATLLKLSPDSYQSSSAGCSPRLVAAIREMRNIPSS